MKINFTKSVYVVFWGAASIFSSCSDPDAALRESALKSLDSLEKARSMEVHTADEPPPIIPSSHIEPRGATTTLQFADDGKFKFGKIKEGEKVSHDFVFTNTGDIPLTILTCKASCGCTVPEWDKAPIAPKKTGKIHVVFDSKGKLGTQVKSVTVTANTEPSRTVIALVGEVLEVK